MVLNDILLHIDSYPEPTPLAAIDRAVGFAAELGGQITALAVQIEIPVRSNRVADHLIGLSRLAREEEAKSRDACLTSLEHFAAKAKAAGVFRQSLLEKAGLYDLADHVARRARTRDFCIVPLAGRFDGQQEVAQSVIFSSGRPVLAFAADVAVAPPRSGVVVVAWDGGRCAARAMADALPILSRAREVRVLTVLNEKPTLSAKAGTEAVRHLKAHDIEATVDEVDAAGDPIGLVLDRYLRRAAPDLLVMGAYGHSRLREFVLGGATAHLLHDPLVPVFMSH